MLSIVISNQTYGDLFPIQKNEAEEVSMFPDFESLELVKVSDVVQKPKAPEFTLKTIRVPIVGTGWARQPICSDPNCAMCFTQYQNKTMRIQNPDPQASAPTTERDNALAQLKLTSNDVFADIGCGDGNVLITAVKNYGVKSAIGIEIDPDKVSEARSNVRRAGLESRIQIIEADAEKFDLQKNDVTAAYVYLYPDLLKAIDFRGVSKIVSVYHDIPNLNTNKIGNSYVFQSKTQRTKQPSVAVNQSITNQVQTSSGHWEKRCYRDRRGRVTSCQMVWVAN